MSSTFMRQKLQNYAESATFHGLSHVYNGQMTEKIFWLSIILGLSGVVGSLTFQIVEKYFSRKVYLESRHVYSKELIFPTITICNNNKMLPWYIPGQPQFENLTQNVFSTGFYEFSTAYKPFCIFAGKYCDIAEFNTVEKHVSCLSFNERGNYTQTFPGAHSGLSFLIYINNSEFKNKAEFGRLEMVLSYPGDFWSLYYDEFILSTNSEYNIELRQKTRYNLPAPFPSNCHEETENEHYIKLVGRYTHSQCLTSNALISQYLSCGDVFIPLFRPSVTPFLKSITKHNKSMKNTKNCIEHAMQNLTENKCHLPCKEVRYERSIYPLNWKMSEDILTSLKRGSKENMTKESTAESFVRINIYFPRLEYEVVSEQPAYSLKELASDFGGLMGISLGASMISILELVIIVVLTIRTRREKDHASK